MTFDEWWVGTKPKDILLMHSVANIVWHAAQKAMRERAAYVADEHICGCGDHATEAGRLIRALPVE